MTNEELLTDLKQFIDSRLSQETAQLTRGMQSMEKHLDARIDEVQDAIAETLSQATEAIDVTEKLHEFDKRLLRLERRTI